MLAPSFSSCFLLLSLFLCWFCTPELSILLTLLLEKKRGHSLKMKIPVESSDWPDLWPASTMIGSFTSEASSPVGYGNEQLLLEPHRKFEWLPPDKRELCFKEREGVWDWHTSMSAPDGKQRLLGWGKSHIQSTPSLMLFEISPTTVGLWTKHLA